jgi:hypothetical protein
VRDGRKKDEFGAVGMEEAGADTRRLAPWTRDSELQPDHVNEPDFDGKRAEGENGVSDSAVLSLPYKKLRKTGAAAKPTACVSSRRPTGRSRHAPNAPRRIRITKADAGASFKDLARTGVTNIFGEIRIGCLREQKVNFGG